MKKLSFVTLALFLVLTLSGCGGAQKSNDDSQANSETEEIGTQDNQESGAEENGEKGIVAKIKNSISAGKKMKCTYKMSEENGDTEVITYIQGEKYKTEIMLGQMKTVSIFDGDAMYSWSEGQKTGTKMEMDCIDSLDVKGEVEREAVNENAVATEDQDDFVKTLSEAQNLNCEDAGDVDFSVPSDMEFIDQCEMLKSQQKMIEGLNK
ncbi:MAG: hypothetical protein UR60_C0041G0003 [Candidatus Moranbacteria bacterium GW2011_GWF2_34_56]|nr:MAG: hypothetical protein UR51_C0011G0040 [Candidatus Moranbacteria bacterium GW2011_GWF1_34_10]KKP63705.1 MAG: hypothetical protein UR60_C0041G0003 [Candidatus Moranbacteria bacterium GW2011_GWF2_34_56]HBI16770.1 hypothetical protein [Candidatus Moranbacteria bacterium]